MPINRPQISLPQKDSSQDNKTILFPIKIIDHSPQDSGASNTSAEEKDVVSESQEAIVVQEKESKWFNVAAGILVATVPMVLGGYLLHVLTRGKESDIQEQTAISEPMPKSSDEEDLAELKEVLIAQAKKKSSLSFTFKEISARSYLGTRRIATLIKKYPSNIASWFGGTKIQVEKGSMCGGGFQEKPFGPSTCKSRYSPSTFEIVAEPMPIKYPKYYYSRSMDAYYKLTSIAIYAIEEDGNFVSSYIVNGIPNDVIQIEHFNLPIKVQKHKTGEPMPNEFDFFEQQESEVPDTPYYRVEKMLGELPSMLDASRLFKPALFDKIEPKAYFWFSKNRAWLVQVPNESVAEKVAIIAHKNLVARRFFTSSDPLLYNLDLYITYPTGYIKVDAPTKVTKEKSVDNKYKLVRKGKNFFGEKGFILSGTNGNYRMEIVPYLKQFRGVFSRTSASAATIEELDQMLDDVIQKLTKIVTEPMPVKKLTRPQKDALVVLLQGKQFNISEESLYVLIGNGYIRMNEWGDEYELTDEGRDIAINEYKAKEGIRQKRNLESKRRNKTMTGIGMKKTKYGWE